MRSIDTFESDIIPLRIGPLPWLWHIPVDIDTFGFVGGASASTDEKSITLTPSAIVSRDFIFLQVMICYCIVSSCSRLYEWDMWYILCHALFISSCIHVFRLSSWRLALLSYYSTVLLYDAAKLLALVCRIGSKSSCTVRSTGCPSRVLRASSYYYKSTTLARVVPMWQ
jgi:hypothetical protein